MTYTLCKKMKQVAAVLMFIAPHFLAFAQQYPDDSPERKSVEIIYAAFKKDWIPIPEKDRDQIIKILHQVAFGNRDKIGATLVSSDWATIALIKHGDEDAIRKYCQYWISIYGADLKVFRNLHQPLVIPHLAPQLYKTELLGYNPSLGSDVIYPSFLSSVSSQIIDSLYSDLVPEEVKMSAHPRNWKGIHLSEEELVLIIRNWWEENKEALMSKSYGDLKPLK